MLAGVLILACWVFLVLYWNLNAGRSKPAAERQDKAGRLARMPIWLGFGLLVAAWAGVYNTYYWIDPKRNLCAAVMMQFLPFADKDGVGLLEDFEHAVYANR